MKALQKLRLEIRLTIAKLQVMEQDLFFIEAKELGLLPSVMRGPALLPPIGRRPIYVAPGLSAPRKRRGRKSLPPDTTPLRWPLGMPEDLEHPLNQEPRTAGAGFEPA